MFCRNCGKEVNDGADVCLGCGKLLRERQDLRTDGCGDYSAPKVGMGVLCGFFLGLPGLIVGMILYPDGTNARKTFIKGGLIGFCIDAAIVISIAAAIGIIAVMAHI